jgi:hypothetical protein
LATTSQGPGRDLYLIGLLFLSLPMAALVLLAALALDLQLKLTVTLTTAPVLLLQVAALLAASGAMSTYPFVRASFWTLKLLQKPLRIPLHAPERMVIRMNNLRLLRKGGTYAPGETLILLPHCLQDHTCPHRLTFDPDACERCGKCPVGPLLDLRDKYGVRLAIVTGGTSARKTVKETRPKLIIAVACPVDLSLGILDVDPIDTVGILNEWRHGECLDTWVDTAEVDAVLSSLLTR